MPGTEALRSALANRYSIEREIASGGMATVYLAQDLKHNRNVAVKVLHPDLSATIGVERFLAEISLCAKLDHPHILTLIDSGSVDGVLYYVMPYVRGESLRAKLKREKQLELDEALSITKQVASALDYAHAQGLVHRDIKPENILLHEGEAVLADFGIAVAVDQSGRKRLTATGMSIGTPEYMSPEQAVGERELDRRSDVYSLGAVCYEMIAGEPPMTGATPKALVAKIMTQRPVSLRILRETTPVHVEEGVDKALAKVPADRFKTAGDFARALGAAPPERSLRMSRSAKTLALAAAALCGIALLALLLGRLSETARGDAHTALTDRRLITNTGRISFPAISPDGKSLAYLGSECRIPGCTYPVELQHIDGSASQTIFEGVSQFMYDAIEWSPDRRNVIIYGRINKSKESVLISTLGGVAHRLGPRLFKFWAGGDSLLTVGGNAPNNFWILISGLDAVPRDSILINARAEQVSDVIPLPNTPWIAVALGHGSRVQWVSIDRSGRVGGRAQTRELAPPSARGSADALWVGAPVPGSTLRSVVRIPFDGRTGRFGSREDTVHTGNLTSFGVTADGGTFVYDESTSEHELWALNFRDAIRGVFPEKNRLLTATEILVNEVSADGRNLLIGRVAGPSASGGLRWEVLPFAGGKSTPISGEPGGDWWADSETITLKTQTPNGIELSLLDVSSGARRAPFIVPDSAVGLFVSLPEGGWAWIANGAIRVHRRNEALRTHHIPKWYQGLTVMTASLDGKKLFFAGKRALTADSVRLSVMSLPNGAVTPLKTVFAGPVWIDLQTDGSVIFAVWDSPDWVELHRIRESGETEWVAPIPRRVWSFSVSADMRRSSLTVFNTHGDASMSRVVRRR